MFLITPSIKRWKLAGQPRSPIGDVIQWYCPFPGIVNAVRGWDFSSRCICQNPEVRSRVEKIVEFALPMSPMHSVSLRIEFCNKYKIYHYWMLCCPDSGKICCCCCLLCNCFVLWSDFTCCCFPAGGIAVAVDAVPRTQPHWDLCWPSPDPDDLR